MTEREKSQEDEKKTLIGVLASHDDRRPNISLASVFTHLYESGKWKALQDFEFVFTGGTYRRILYGDETLKTPPIKRQVAKWLWDCSLTLPPTQKGGVILLSYLISQRMCSIVWPFYAPNANHWQRHENLAFMRLCDQWHVKRLMNRGSVMAWCDTETKEDKHRNRQAIPPSLVPRGLEDGNGRGPLLAVEKPQPQEQLGDALAVKPWDVTPKKFSDMTVALIAHDEMKGRMVEFAIDHEAELDKFKRILATGTTGREVAAATEKRIGDKMIRYHSGPKGGDVEIATAVLQGLCDVVIFFIDPLRPHPHIEDIRVVFQACMISEQVVMITNEVHAREFMSRVVREKEGLDFYESSDRDTDRI